MICQSFQTLAIEAWNRRKKSETHNLSLGEETLTDLILLDLKDQNPNEVTLFKFNKIQEAQTGADWEWWLTDGTNWFGMLIQAKKLYLPARDYRSLNQKIGKSRIPQVDQLIGTASSKGIVPLYCFYNFVDAQYEPEIQWKCTGYRAFYELFGCSVAHAQSVKAALHNLSLKSISSISLPWHCLVCCPLHVGSAGGLPSRAAGLALSLAPSEGKSASATFVASEPPEYVELARRTSPENFADLEPKIRELAGPITGIVIIDDTSPPRDSSKEPYQ